MNSPLHEINFRDVTRSFKSRDGQEMLALNTVNLTIKPGEFCSVLGPSGCGKTSLLKMVAGLLRSSSGVVSVGGREVVQPRKDVGVVFQQPLLLPWLNVLDNILLPVDVQGRKRSDFLSRAAELVAMTGLGGFEKRYPAELSGGMQQRVALARGLVLAPSVLLMDEPFAALDAMTRDAMNVELQRIWLNAKTTVLFVTHGISEAVFLGDRVVVMSGRPGRVAATFDIDFPRPRSPSLLGNPTFTHKVAEIRAVFDEVSDTKKAEHVAI